MKRWLLLFLLAAAHVNGAFDVEGEIRELKNETKELQSKFATWTAAESDLLAQLPKFTPGSREALRATAELEETRQLLKALQQRAEALVAHLRQLEESPRHQVVVAIDRDNRRPSKTNLSGVWIAGLGVGYTIQLEQRGQTVTGQGYHWGCLGVYDSFDITGTYQNEVLTLSFKESPEKQAEIDSGQVPGIRPAVTKMVYRSYEEGQRLRFRLQGSDDRGIMPAFDSP